MNTRIFVIILSVTAMSCFGQVGINYTINTQSGQKAISPYIYGTNFSIGGSGENFTCYRFGGNRTTGYNWENNASNAGHDYYHSSDNWLVTNIGVPADKQDSAGSVLTTFVNKANATNARSFITLPMAGYVARDVNGPVTEAETAPSGRWCKVQAVKGAPFSLAPDTSDQVVYVDEEVNFLKQKFGPASQNGVFGYILDNEPSIWPETHPRIHPAKSLCREYADRGIVWSEAVKAVDSSAMVIGPACYGFNAYLTFQDAPDWDTVKMGKNYQWFLDYFLDRMKQASDSAGRRLLDVLDLHYYSSAEGDNLVITPDGTTDTPNDDLARVQAPRTLYDQGYYEKSWIAQYFKSYLPIIPRVQQSIDTYYPGTKLGFTEFDFGGGGVISGGIAMADVLGTFGKYGVYLGTLWSVEADNTYKTSAYQLFRNYDGNNGAFGDISVDATSDDKVTSTVYASVNTTGDSVLHIIVTNKGQTSVSGSFMIDAATQYRSADVYSFSDGLPEISERQNAGITGNTFTYTLDPLSAYHFVVSTKEYVPFSTAGNTQEKDLRIYPDPAGEYFTISGLQDQKDLRLSIYSVSGLLKTSVFIRNFHQSYTCNLNREIFSPGVYLVKLESDKMAYTGKLLIN